MVGIAIVSVTAVVGGKRVKESVQNFDLGCWGISKFRNGGVVALTHVFLTAQQGFMMIQNILCFTSGWVNALAIIDMNMTVSHQSGNTSHTGRVQTRAVVSSARSFWEAWEDGEDRSQLPIASRKFEPPWVAIMIILIITTITIIIIIMIVIIIIIDIAIPMNGQWCRPLGPRGDCVVFEVRAQGVWQCCVGDAGLQGSP